MGISEFGGGTGWTLYPPLSTSFMSLSPSSTGNLIFGLLVSGISSCLTSLNFWITILNLRSYCLTLKTMPLFLWALLITAAMLLLTLPVLSGALLMVWLIFILIHFSLIQSLEEILYSINTYFGFLDIQKFISLPTGTKIFNWLSTYLGNPPLLQL